MRLIDADAAIDALLGITAMRNTIPLDSAIFNIKKLPSIQPERKMGRWIEDAETYYKAVNEKGGGVNENTPYFTDCIACSECLSMFSVIDNETERFDFCPNCGAKMEDERKE